MNDTDLLHNQAEAAVAANRFDDARELYVRISGIDPRDSGARMMLGAIARERGELLEAVEWLRETTAMDPGFTEAWAMLGTVYVQLDRAPEAEAANRRALELEPGLAEARVNLGTALRGQGRFAEAAACYQEALEQQPDLASVWPLLASARLEAGDFAGAEEAARTALSYAPGDGQSLLILGRAQHGQAKLQDAAASFLAVTRLAPDQADAWSMAACVLGQMGDLDEAEGCCREALVLDPEHVGAYLNLGNALRAQRRWEEARDAFQAARDRQPDSLDAICGLGAVYVSQGRYPSAAKCFERAVDLQPENAELHRSLANVLALGGDFSRAESACRRSLELNSESDPVRQLELADILVALGRPDEALKFYDRVLELMPENIRAISGKARAYDRNRDYQLAYDCLRPSIDQGTKDPHLLAAYVGLSKRFDKQDDALQMAEDLLRENDLDDYDRCRVHYCATELCDKLGKYDEAFEHANQAARHKRAEFNRAEYRSYIDTILYAFSAENLRRLPRAENGSDRPVFIVGMPRSGTSLVEQIIASHPEVYGAGELPDIGCLPGRLSSRTVGGIPYPRCMGSLTQEQINQASDEYLDSLSRWSVSARRVTDKMPQNFTHLGVIELLFPNARVIHTMRDPMDTCLSCYFKNFAGHLPYTYALEDLAHYYNEYERLMAHWRNVLGIPLLEVQYEDLVQQPEEYSRRLIEFCGLEWDDACLKFYESKRLVNTASYDQVRQPVYTGSVGRWQAYAQHLQPLREGLNQH